MRSREKRFDKFEILQGLTLDDDRLKFDMFAMVTIILGRLVFSKLVH